MMNKNSRRMLSTNGYRFHAAYPQLLTDLHVVLFSENPLFTRSKTTGYVQKEGENYVQSKRLCCVWSLNGVCQIADIRKDNYDKSNETEYYILKPVYNTSITRYYGPGKNSNIMMRAISTKNDVLSLIARMPDIETTS